MPELPVLRELLVVLTVSLVTVFLVRKLRLPNTVGFLVAGLLVGPGVLGLVQDRHAIEVLAEIGIVLLLFTIGLKISLRDLARLRTLTLGAGGMQVGVTIGVVFALAVASGLPLRPAVFLGCLLALSSTAVVLKSLEDRGESDAPYGRLVLGILVFQDLAIVPMMLFIPLLGGAANVSLGQAILTLLESLGLIAAILVAALVLLPWLFERVVRTRSPELFTLSVLVAVLGTAWLFNRVGLSLALGAFLAGIVVSESRYAAQILSEVTPFRDTLGSLFFVSVGMLVDPAVWARSPLLMLGLSVGLMATKALIVFGVVFVFRLGLRVAGRTSLALAQVGEFSFVLAAAGRVFELIDESVFQAFLSVSVVSMAMTPVLIMFSPRITDSLERVSWLAALFAGPTPTLTSDLAGHAALENHVIVVGAGVAGQNVARALRLIEVPHLFLELNPLTVQRMRTEGERILYGDATQREVLKKVAVASARTVVVTIPDPAAVRRIVSVARSLNPDVTLIVRTRFLSEVDALHKLGANEVVPEEYVTAIELVDLVLIHYGVPGRQRLRELVRLRSGQYRALRDPTVEPHPSLNAMTEAADFEEIALAAGSPAEGRSLRDLDLRRRSGASVIGLDRGHRLWPNPDPGTLLEAGDVLVLFGTAEQMQAAVLVLQPGEVEDLHASDRSGGGVGRVDVEGRGVAPPEQGGRETDASREV